MVIVSVFNRLVAFKIFCMFGAFVFTLQELLYRSVILNRNSVIMYVLVCCSHYVIFHIYRQYLFLFIILRVCIKTVEYLLYLTVTYKYLLT